jgi:2-aminoadipate transaminase
MFVWARFVGDAADVDTAALLPAALDAGMAFVPGNAFAVSPPGPHTHHLRLSFATPTPSEIDDAVRRLACTLDSAVVRGSGRSGRRR